MDYTETAKMTSKGQVTIPLAIREILRLEPGSTIMFKITNRGVILSPCEIVEKSLYTAKEWGQIERQIAEKGKVYKSPAAAKKHVESL
jgi:AbrB family looped-hinge helix DNA binding protein